MAMKSKTYHKLTITNPDGSPAGTHTRTHYRCDGCGVEHFAEAIDPEGKIAAVPAWPGYECTCPAIT